MFARLSIWSWKSRLGVIRFLIKQKANKYSESIFTPKYTYDKKRKTVLTKTTIFLMNKKFIDSMGYFYWMLKSCMS